MERAIATGQLIVRQMTAEERERSAARRDKTQAREAGRDKRVAVPVATPA
jgi:hypothetical protein